MTYHDDHITLKLETAYVMIEQERMKDVPILNPALKVEAIGFVPFEGHFLGVMITPWFMNLMIVPAQNDQDPIWSAESGDKQSFSFPAGKFDFLFGKDDLIGHHYACALFSPMYEFSDQDTAVLTAQNFLTQLMQPRELDELDLEKHNQSRLEEIWSEDDEAPEETADKPAGAQAAPIEPDDQPDLSRRSFLRLKKEESPFNPETDQPAS